MYQFDTQPWKPRPMTKRQWRARRCLNFLFPGAYGYLRPRKRPESAIERAIREVWSNQLLQQTQPVLTFQKDLSGDVKAYFFDRRLLGIPVYNPPEELLKNITNS